MIIQSNQCKKNNQMINPHKIQIFNKNNKLMKNLLK